MHTVVLGNPITKYRLSGRSFMDENTGIIARGITKVIKQIFVPRYSFRRLQNKPPSSGLSRKLAKRNGVRIDRELENWAKNPTLFKSSDNKVNTCLSKLGKLGSPIASQLVVGLPHARVATAIDLMLYNDTSRVIFVVEVKTGCNYRHCDSGSFFSVYSR